MGKTRVNVSSKEAEKTVLKKIVADNVTKVYYKIKKAGDKVEEREMTIIPRRPDISIKTILTHVPKWRITLKAAGITYKRRVLAASKVVLVDEIAFYSAKHFSLGRIWNNRRRISVVCEICGGAFCDDHIFPINNTPEAIDH